MTIENEGLRGLGNIVADAAGGKPVRGRTGSAVRQRSDAPEETVSETKIRHGRFSPP